MTFNFGSNTYGDTIRHVDVKDKDIVIEYLNNDVDLIPYNVDNLNKIKQRMIDQAKERNNSKEAEKLFYARNNSKSMVLKNITMNAICIAINAYFIASSPDTRLRWFYVILILIYLFFATTFIRKVIKFKNLTDDKIEELEKYDEFLTLQEDFEKNGISINDLDNFSLDEIIEKEKEMNENAKTKKLV